MSRKIADLIRFNRECVVSEWSDAVQRESVAASFCPEPVLRNHILEILGDIERALYKIDDSEPARSTDEMYGSQPPSSGGWIHGKQRASVRSYTPDQIYWEYVLLRRVLVRLLRDHGVDDGRSLEAINCILEKGTQSALSSFQQSIEQVQRTLIGTLVHDLRTPLNVVSGIGQLLANGPDETMRKQGAHLQQASRRMGRMVDEMLLTVVMEGGQGFDMEFESGHVLRHLDILGKDCAALYGDRFKMVLPEAEPAVAIDPAAVTRTLENLISNAFKYGAADEDVIVRVEERGSDLVLSVHNHGNPIRPEDRAGMFEFLQKNDGPRHNREKSWGMGLALARATAEGHKGRIEVQSSAEDGTVFSLILPKGARKDGETATVII